MTSTIEDPSLDLMGPQFFFRWHGTFTVYNWPLRVDLSYFRYQRFWGDENRNLFTCPNVWFKWIGHINDEKNNVFAESVQEVHRYKQQLFSVAINYTVCRLFHSWEIKIILTTSLNDIHYHGPLFESHGPPILFFRWHGPFTGVRFRVLWVFYCPNLWFKWIGHINDEKKSFCRIGQSFLVINNNNFGLLLIRLYADYSIHGKLKLNSRLP